MRLQLLRYSFPMSLLFYCLFFLLKDTTETFNAVWQYFENIPLLCGLLSNFWPLPRLYNFSSLTEIIHVLYRCWETFKKYHILGGYSFWFFVLILYTPLVLLCFHYGNPFVRNSNNILCPFPYLGARFKMECRGNLFL